MRNNAFDAYHIGPRSKSRRFALRSAALGTLQCAIEQAKSDWIFKHQLGRVNVGICGASGSKAAWAAIKTLKRGLRPSKCPLLARMKLPDATFAFSAEETAAVLAKHFEKLYNSGESIYDETFKSSIAGHGARSRSHAHPNLSCSRLLASCTTQPQAL